MSYNPDRWALVKIDYNVGTEEETTGYRIMATWYGGYLHGDSWKLSSGVVKVERIDNALHFHNNSGSVYICRDGGYGMGAFTSSVYSELVTSATNHKFTLIEESLVPAALAADVVGGCPDD